MGILAEPAEFVRALKLPTGFSVCELGDQYITHDVRRLASEFYLELGCGRYVSIDGNGRGTFTYDLNKPLRTNHLGEFDLVTDFGTGEHIFDQATVWKTVHYLTKAQGYIVFDRPTQGYSGNGGHCYYNTHECLFNDIAAANDYVVHKLEHQQTTRGELIRGVFQKMRRNKFRVPQQGRYKKLLRPITEKC
jgi:hypothetical protein